MNRSLPVLSQTVRRLSKIVGRLALVVAAAGLLGCVSVPDPNEEQDQARMANARRNIGLDHLKNGRMAMAIRELNRADEMNPDDPYTLAGLAEALRYKERYDDAERYLLRAIEIDPDFHEARLSLSGLYIQLERYEESIMLARALMDDPTFPTPWRALTNLGHAQMKLGRLAEARASLLEALDYRFNFWPALLNLGILEASDGRKLAAIQYFRQVLESQLGYNAEAEVNYRLAQAYASVGRRDEALKHFQSAVEVSPYGRWGRQSESYLKLLQ